MSDGGRGRRSLGMEVWESSQKWSARRSVVRSIAWLGVGIPVVASLCIRLHVGDGITDASAGNLRCRFDARRVINHYGFPSRFTFDSAERRTLDLSHAPARLNWIHSGLR